MVGWHKLNVRLASRVLRDSAGDFIAARAVPISLYLHPWEAKAVSLREALSWLKQLNIYHVCGYHGFLGPDPLLNRLDTCAGPLPGSPHEAAYYIKTTQKPTRRYSSRTRLRSQVPLADHLTAYGKFIMGKYAKYIFIPEFSNF